MNEIIRNIYIHRYIYKQVFSEYDTDSDGKLNTQTLIKSKIDASLMIK